MTIPNGGKIRNDSALAKWTYYQSVSVYVYMRVYVKIEEINNFVQNPWLLNFSVSDECFPIFQ